MIPLFKVAMSPTVPEAVGKTLMSGFVGQGPKVEEFEALLKERFKNKNLLTVNSGTSALHLAMRLVNPKYHRNPYAEPDLWPTGNEILTTPLTCTATNWPALANGYDLKWVDVDPTTLNIDLQDLERKITSKTAAIIVVHWGGYPVDLDTLYQIQIRAQEKFGIWIPVIEDCAHAFGTVYNGYPLGNHGNYCAFSFQAIKHFTTVDGGMLITPRNLRQAKLLRWYGIDREGTRKDFRCEDDISEWGYKFHMNDVNATIGIENLKIVDNVVWTHQKNGLFFNKKLQGIDGVTLLSDRFEKLSSYWIYSMHVERRDDFMRAMTDRGVMVSRVHERNDIHSCVKKYSSLLPNLEEVAKTMICIPCGWWLEPDDTTKIIDAIKMGW